MKFISAMQINLHCLFQFGACYSDFSSGATLISPLELEQPPARAQAVAAGRVECTQSAARS
jgi:hypothetical protein